MKAKLTILLLLLATSMMAQELTLKSFSLDETDLTARTTSVKDKNGEPCALVKVGLVVPNATFRGDIIDMLPQTSEYWVYLTEGATYLEVQVPGYLTYNYDFPEPLKKNCTYRLILQNGDKTTLFRIQPAFQIGSLTGISVSIGLNFGGFDIELGGVKGLGKEEYYVYRPDGTEMGKSAFDAMSFEAKIGYKINVAEGFAITPQVGASMLAVSDGLLVENANAISGIAGVRVSYSLARNFALFATPSLSFKLTESDGYKQICEKVDNLSKWSGGFNLKVGLSIEF